MKKKPSKKFRDDFGHTPLSVEEDTRNPTFSTAEINTLQRDIHRVVSEYF